jgi:hypothetical protein
LTEPSIGEVMNNEEDKELERIKRIVNRIKKNHETNSWLLRALKNEDEWGSAEEIGKLIDFNKLIMDSLNTLNTLNISEELFSEIFTPDKMQYILRINMLLEWYVFYDSQKKNLLRTDYCKFNCTFGEIFHYLEYLQIIAERYAAYSQDYRDNNKAFLESFEIDNLSEGVVHKMNSEQRDLQNRNRIIETHLHLEVESFYQFAKILLDKTAIAVEFYFGKENKKENRIPLSSFRQEFVKNIERYAQKKNLSSYDIMLNMAEKLKEDISFFRDKRIVHMFADRDINKMGVVRGTVCDADSIKLIIANLFSGEEDRSKSLLELLTTIEAYIEQILVFIKANKEKTILKINLQQ